jgi:integrase
MLVPAMVAAAGERAARRFLDFFTANIRNPNTRAAYGVGVRSFFAWLDRHGIGELGATRTHHVSTYIESLTRSYRAPTVKQHLAALRMLFDWLIVGQVVEQNPAAVRGPKHVIKKGKTPVLDGDEAKKLLDSIDGSRHRPGRIAGIVAQIRNADRPRLSKAHRAVKDRDFLAMLAAGHAVAEIARSSRLHRATVSRIAAEAIAIND